MSIKRPYIYVASSWRNGARQQAVVRALRDWGADVYDFRQPCYGALGFGWDRIDPKWKNWKAEQFIEALDHPLARDGFRVDMNALKAADLCVLVMPCGRSAHLELGYCVGSQKPTGILLTDGEPELMYAMADFITTSETMLCMWAKGMWDALGFEEVVNEDEDKGKQIQ